MRRREMSYEDYGMTDAEVRYIKEFCRNANDEDRSFIKNALAEIPPYVAPYVYYSLVDKISYDEMCKKRYIYISKGDFYGHRRYAVNQIKKMMIAYGLWKM
jgi:oligoribonuclease (3'-5' exoribonuclease)